jgi:NTE family protein
VFLDQLDQDVLEMQMINRLVRELPEEKRHGMRDIKLLVIRPSEDIGAIAYELRHELPTTLSYLLRRIGTGDIGSQDFLSTVLFQAKFIERLIQLGQRDGDAHSAELKEFLESSSNT